MKRVLVAIILFLLLVAGTGFLFGRAEAGRIPRGVYVGGVDVGGLTPEEARPRLENARLRLLQRPVVLRHPNGTISITAGALGAEVDVGSATGQALSSRNALERFRARVGLADPVQVPLRVKTDAAGVARAVQAVAARLDRPPTNASLGVIGGKIVLRRARVGRAVAGSSLSLTLTRLPQALKVPFRVLSPRVDDRAALRTKVQAEILLRHSPSVRYRGVRVTLDAPTLAKAMRFQPRKHRLQLTFSPKVLAPSLRPAFARFERRPQDARFRVVDPRVRVLPSANGRRLNIPAMAKSLITSSREVRALFAPVPPRMTTEAAKAFRIRELVSTFTTPYPCCPPRVTNIQRGADILDGTIIRAGATFSLNDALGRRTPRRGFVEAPMILAGKLVDAVGGGVSQIATTVYNAAFFAGVDLLAHTPHEFYISRYPIGREATVSWGGPELIFRNDWPAAILMKVSADTDSITVRFFSSRLGRRIVTRTSHPSERRPAQVRTEVDRALAPGQRIVAQEGGVDGFSVTYTRRVWRGRRLLHDEHFHVRYQPEHTLVLVGPPVLPRASAAGGSSQTGPRSPGRRK